MFNRLGCGTGWSINKISIALGVQLNPENYMYLVETLPSSHDNTAQQTGIAQCFSFSRRNTMLVVMMI